MCRHVETQIVSVRVVQAWQQNNGSLQQLQVQQQCVVLFSGFSSPQYSAPDTSEAHTLFYSLEKWKVEVVRRWRQSVEMSGGGGKRGSERKRDRRVKCSGSREKQQEMGWHNPRQEADEVFLGVLLRQVILMRHDILFWWEGWLAMQKLTDGQEIQYWNKIRQKS